MKNIIKQTGLGLLAMVIVFAASCRRDKIDLEPKVAAFGPNPALRGSEMTFRGQGLDKVVKVTFQTNVEVVDINIVSESEISVIVPQDAEQGVIVLTLQDGKTITTRGEVSYTEPIKISSITPNLIKAGQTLTIRGDYLNLVQKVLFNENEDVFVSCASFTTWTREEISFVLPATALTGTVVLTDTSENPFKLKSDTVLNVVLPAVTTVDTLKGKKSEDIVTVAGTDFDLVTSVVMPDGNAVEFTKNQEGTSLSFTLPDNASDGVITVLPASGVIVPIRYLVMAVPIITAVNPKRDLVAENVITVTGTNMELVTTVIIPGNEAVAPLTKSATEITVKMTATSKSGALVLNTGSGKMVEDTIWTLKPTVTAFEPTSAIAGKEIIMRGTDLDLVKSVTFGGDQTTENFAAVSQDSIAVVVPAYSETGKVVLTMGNGETVDCSVLAVSKPEFCYIQDVNELKTDIFSANTLKATVKNSQRLVQVKINNNTVQFFISDNILYAHVPSGVAGDAVLKLVSDNGEIEYPIKVKNLAPAEYIVDETPHTVGWNGEGEGGAFKVYKESLSELAAGTKLKFYYTPTGGGDPQLKVQDANWVALEIDDPGFNAGYGVLALDPDASYYEWTMTQETVDGIMNTDDEWGTTTGLIIAGQNAIITKITIVPGGGVAPTDTNSVGR